MFSLSAVPPDVVVEVAQRLGSRHDILNLCLTVRLLL